MNGLPAARGGKRIVLAFVTTLVFCPIGRGPGAQEYTVEQPQPPASHARLACASGSEQGRLQHLLKSWKAAYAEWESAVAKLESAKPAYDQAQAELDQALAHERSFANQLAGIMRGAWSPELFAASSRRDKAYEAVRAANEEAERAFNALQAARSSDEELWTEISKRSCARPRGESQAQKNPPAGAQPTQAQMPVQGCRQLIVSEAIRCQ
jgi:chromosome segregation ATPase